MKINILMEIVSEQHYKIQKNNEWVGLDSWDPFIGSQPNLP